MEEAANRRFIKLHGQVDYRPATRDEFAAMIMNQYHCTLWDLERLTQKGRNSDTWRYVFALTWRLEQIVFDGRAAVSSGDLIWLAEVKAEYAVIRGKGGRPRDIDDYFGPHPDAKPVAADSMPKWTLKLQDAALDIIAQSCGRSVGTISRYPRRGKAMARIRIIRTYNFDSFLDRIPDAASGA